MVSFQGNLKTHITYLCFEFGYSLSVAVVLAKNLFVGQRVRQKYVVSLCNIGGVDTEGAVAFKQQAVRIESGFISFLIY